MCEPRVLFCVLRGRSLEQHLKYFGMDPGPRVMSSFSFWWWAALIRLSPSSRDVKARARFAQTVWRYLTPSAATESVLSLSMVNIEKKKTQLMMFWLLKKINKKGKVFCKRWSSGGDVQQHLRLSWEGKCDNNRFYVLFFLPIARRLSRCCFSSCLFSVRGFWSSPALEHNLLPQLPSRFGFWGENLRDRVRYLIGYGIALWDQTIPMQTFECCGFLHQKSHFLLLDPWGVTLRSRREQAVRKRPDCMKNNPNRNAKPVQCFAKSYGWKKPLR